MYSVANEGIVENVLGGSAINTIYICVEIEPKHNFD
jgi:hypothetical protein